MFPGFGHGIGMGTQDPYIMPGVATVVEENMVIAVEILLSRSGIGGAGFEQDADRHSERWRCHHGRVPSPAGWS